MPVSDDGQGAVEFALGGADEALFEIDDQGNWSFVDAPDFETATDEDDDNVYEVSVTASDEAGGDTVNLNVTVLDLDDVPTTVVLNAITVAENDPGAPLADIIISDPDTDLGIDDVALSDNTNFRVIGAPGALQLALAEGVALDFEAGTQPSVAVSVNDTSTLFTPAPTDDLSDNPNTAPTLSVTAEAADENIEQVRVATFSAGDLEDGAATVTVDDDRFAVVGTDIVLKVGQTLDHETDDATTITVTATDSVGLQTTVTLTLQVTDINEAPTLSATAPVTGTVPSTGGIVSLDGLVATDPENDVTDAGAC